MDIPYGHRIKILKSINIYKESNIRPLSNNEYEEMPFENNKEMINTKSEMGVGKETFKQSSNETFKKDSKENNIDEDIYNEEEQSRLFREAVIAFRSAKTLEQNKKNSMKSIREVTENDENNENPKNFLFNVGGDLFNFDNFMPSSEKVEDAGVVTDPMLNFLPFNKTKTMCWICYKIISNTVTMEQEKPFCSKTCYDIFLKQNMVSTFC
jgi:hypothetical protein